ncbi:MAG TPA: cytochrome c [Dongiaceae bacterium]|nr:cytochrome c [Dongiaceae bacterium]
MSKMKSLRALAFIVPAFALPAFADLLISAPTVADTPITFKSVSVTLPESDRMFPGPGADPINNNCLACHSAGMVLNQPAMTHDAWQAEVNKMINSYKAPVAAEDVAGIVDYLVKTKGLN